jgi:2',3'-cyclic-nucleotide 2'-phosphodiesterase (5'-nucleotidase family)
MSNKRSICSIFDLQDFAVENSEGNLRIVHTTDLHTLVMTEVINIISPYEITNIAVKPYGNYEKLIWDTDLPYIKYSELLCAIFDHLDQVEEEYYDELIAEYEADEKAFQESLVE